VTYWRFQLSIRIFALLLSIALALALALAGCTDARSSNPEAATTAPPEPAVSAAPATPPSAPVATKPPVASTTPPSAPPTAETATTGNSTATTGKAAETVAPPAEIKEASLPKVTGPKVRYNAGEDPEYAKRRGWPVKPPPPLPGSILPQKRIVAYYGNPLSKRMGALGEYPKDEMLRRLKGEVAKWEKADPSLPVQPALHLIAVVAQGNPGKAGKYRMIMPDTVVNRVYGWAKEAGASSSSTSRPAIPTSAPSCRASSGC
jgi:hypothetical protein